MDAFDRYVKRVAAAVKRDDAVSDAPDEGEGGYAGEIFRYLLDDAHNEGLANTKGSYDALRDVYGEERFTIMFAGVLLGYTAWSDGEAVHHWYDLPEFGAAAIIDETLFNLAANAAGETVYGQRNNDRATAWFGGDDVSLTDDPYVALQRAAATAGRSVTARVMADLNVDPRYDDEPVGAASAMALAALGKVAYTHAFATCMHARVVEFIDATGVKLGGARKTAALRAAWALPASEEPYLTSKELVMRAFADMIEAEVSAVAA